MAEPPALVQLPVFDLATKIAGAWMADALLKSPEEKWEALLDEECVRPVIQRELTANHEYFWGLGHGRPDRFSGWLKQPVIDEANLTALRGKVAHLFSCLTGQRLGKLLVERGGAKAFIGYRKRYIIGLGVDPRPSSDYSYALARLDTIMGEAILKGYSVREAKAIHDRALRMLVEYFREDPWAPLILRALIHNHDALVIYGDEGARPCPREGAG